MKANLTSASLVFLLVAFPAAAQRHETFADRPSKRQEKVQAARERAQREKEEARQWAKARGLKMRHDDGQRLIELMAIRNGRPVYYITHNHNAAISTTANMVRDTTPYNVNGSGVTVGVWDAGAIRPDHQEFVGRLTIKDGSATHYHATHVGGTIGASGVQPLAKGMASGASIHSYSWSDEQPEMTSVAASYAGELNKIMLSNHSYGIAAGWRGSYWYGDTWNASSQDETFGQYSSYCYEWDDILYDAPYFLPFVSAGNDREDGSPANGSQVFYQSGGDGDWISTTYNSASHPKGDGIYKGGYDTISDKAVCKNTMTVGAVLDAVLSGQRTLPVVYTSFTSWGPADDGRIKPDIVANGSSLYSTYASSTSSYMNLSGTSMSSPNACGSAALLVDYYDDLFPGDAMRASTLKGLIIHTADDLGNPGPDYCYGWGLMNTLAAAELLKDYSADTTRLTEATVTTSQSSDTYSFVNNGLEPVRVTLCWTDPPGTPTTNQDSRASKLINDLDLKVVGPGGTYWPYKLDYNNPSGNATAVTENDIDNVEQVYIALPTAGEYTITVDYDGILSGGTQWYSLLISGTGSDSDGDGMPDYWESTYFQSPTGAIATEDWDGDGADNLTEYISGYDPMDSNSVFKVTSFAPPSTGNSPFILTWNPVQGRRYSIGYDDNLTLPPGFIGIAGATNLPYTQNSYIDTVERVGPTHFYRVNVRLGQ